MPALPALHKPELRPPPLAKASKRSSGCVAWMNPMDDFAFIQLAPGRYLCGLGPFEALSCPPGNERTAFYRNTFDLSDPAPWKVPSRTFVASDPRILLADNGSTPLPEIAWSGLGDGEVREIFNEILERIRSGKLQKSVPVLTERGTMHRGEPSALVKTIASAPEPLHGYGFREGSRGVIGATPEKLFSLHDGVLEAMALAGTAPRHEWKEFPADPKEILEHELVANYLETLLAPLGKVERGPRSLLHLGSIVHFLTRLEVRLRTPEADFESLVKRLHPTPALGAWPRGDGALRQLLEYRRKLGVPEHFGAPFGVLHEGGFDVLVAIRNLSWDGADVFLPSGVGLVEGSRFDREWRELALKRNSVKSLLGV